MPDEAPRDTPREIDRLSLARRLNRIRQIVICRTALRFPRLMRWLHTPRPFVMQQHEYAGSNPVRDLLVLLPGIGDSVENFHQYGFIDPVREMDWPVDIVMVDGQYGYFANHTALQLHEAVFRPAKACGYRRIWLAGVSTGGFGALVYASRYPSDITGVVAMAPFLGQRGLIKEIAGAGGIIHWSNSHADDHDEARKLWCWLKSYVERGPELPDLYLGFGEQDLFARAQHLLAAALPKDHVFTEPGDHRWPTWAHLWARFLQVPAHGVGRP